MNAALARPLVAAAAGDPNPAWLAQILAARRAGHGCLPWRLGLAADAYAALLVQLEVDGGAAPAGDLRQGLLDLRRRGWQELCGLLLAGRRGAAVEEVWLAAVLAAACLGGNHLWRDLGLASRQQLRELLLHNFPTLAQRNVNDMRWKKFFYKQLCERDGGHGCRAPSCAQCPTYHDCFGEEL